MASRLPYFPTGPKPTLVTATDLNTLESQSCSFKDDYVLIVDGTCTFEVTAVEDDGRTHLLRVTGRALPAAAALSEREAAKDA